MNQDLPSSPETPAPFWSFENNPDVLHIDRDEFPGTRPGLRAIREMAETAAINAPLAEMAVAEFVMAIDELSANIVEHGYEKQETTTGQEGESPLIIEIGRFPDRLEALITDHVAIRFWWRMHRDWGWLLSFRTHGLVDWDWTSFVIALMMSSNTGCIHRVIRHGW